MSADYKQAFYHYQKGMVEYMAKSNDNVAINEKDTGTVKEISQAVSRRLPR